MSEDLHDARTLIAQHAKTASLLGVDFLPLGRAGAAECDEPSPVVQEHESAPVGHVSDEQVDVQRGVQRGDQIEPISADVLRAVYGGIGDPQGQLDALRGKYEAESPHRHFDTQFTNIVFGEGSASAELMFIGEAPGEHEDLIGRPFVGPAGELLEKMIGAMGLSRETVYITNVLKTRPPNNATPTGQACALCSPYLMEQIRIVSPRVIVALGLSASHVLLRTTSPMRSLRGHWHELAGSGGSGGAVGAAGSLGEIAVMPTYHPAYLLRSYTPQNRRMVWGDLTMVMEKLGIMPEKPVG